MTFHEGLNLFLTKAKSTQLGHLISTDFKRIYKFILQPIISLFVSIFKFCTSRLDCKKALEIETINLIENCFFISDNYFKKMWAVRIGDISAEVYDNICYGMLNRKLFNGFSPAKFAKLIKFICAYMVIRENGRFEVGELRKVFRFSALEIKKLKYMAAFYLKDINCFELEFIKLVSIFVFEENKPEPYTVAVISNIIYNSYNRVCTEYWQPKKRQIPA